VIIFFAILLLGSSYKGIWKSFFFIGGKRKFGDDIECFLWFIDTSFYIIFSFSKSIWEDFFSLWYYLALSRFGIGGLNASCFGTPWS
jgi:hypothetical protein